VVSMISAFSGSVPGGNEGLAWDEDNVGTFRCLVVC